MKRELDLSQDIGFCYLKPNYTGIENEFTADLGQAGIRVIDRGEAVLDKGIIEYIYSDSRGEDFYPSMLEMLARRAIVAMMVMREDSQAMSAQATIEALKRGTQGYPNLREKYQREEHRVSDAVFEQWRDKRLGQIASNDITYMLTQDNVFHGSDGPHDAIGTMLRMREHPRLRSVFGGPFAQEPAIEVVDRLDKILIRHSREKSMANLKRTWHIIDDMPENDDRYPIRQVYVWLITSDSHLVIVSKNGRDWQLPGGKPEPGESAVDTAVREVAEETHIDISKNRDNLNFFGEYLIDDSSIAIHPPKYRQVRAWLQLGIPANELYISTSGEVGGSHPEDAVRFVKAVPAQDILQYIEWLGKADEYKALKRRKIIPRPWPLFVDKGEAA